MAQITLIEGLAGLKTLKKRHEELIALRTRMRIANGGSMVGALRDDRTPTRHDAGGDQPALLRRAHPVPCDPLHLLARGRHPSHGCGPNRTTGSCRQGARRKVPAGVNAELRKLYYEIAGSANTPAMSALMNLVPRSQVLFGSDYPWDGSTAR